MDENMKYVYFDTDKFKEFAEKLENFLKKGYPEEVWIKAKDEKGHYSGIEFFNKFTNDELGVIEVQGEEESSNIHFYTEMEDIIEQLEYNHKKGTLDGLIQIPAMGMMNLGITLELDADTIEEIALYYLEDKLGIKIEI